MTIRNRVTLWYASVLFVALILIAGGMYFELVYERQETQRRGRPIEPMEEELGEVILYFIVPAMLAAVAGGWWLLRRSLAPLDNLAAAAERIQMENMREPLPRTGNGDEVDRLTQVLNAMNGRILEALNEINEFTLHASHELKTPLAILHSEIETSLVSSDPSKRESLASQLDEIQRLTRIVEGLGLVARANSGQMVLSKEPVAIHEILHEIADDAVILAQPRKVSVSVGNVDPATISGDRHRLRQMLLNLVDNASKYNQSGGLVTITSKTSPDRVTLEISNTGDGIQPEEAAHIFKKFQRSKHGSVNSDGVGLGLTIAQSIAKAHNGEITVDLSRAGWTTFRIVLPISGMS